MLKTTSELIEYLKLGSSSRKIGYLKPLINSILKCGDKSDADAILSHYLKDPFESEKTWYQYKDAETRIPQMC